MPIDNQTLLTEQHHAMEQGISGLVDGSGSRQEMTDAIHLLRRHIYVEETVLFPILDADPSRWMALAQMRYEHGDMWPHIAQAVALLDTGAWLDDLLPAASALQQLLHAHDGKEERAIYSVADRYVPDATHPPLADLFANNAVPAGWRCLRAPGPDGQPSRAPID